MSDNPESPAEALELETRVPTATDKLTLDAEAQLQEFLSNLLIFIGVYIQDSHLFQDFALTSRFFRGLHVRLVIHTAFMAFMASSAYDFPLLLLSRYCRFAFQDFPNFLGVYIQDSHFFQDSASTF